VEFGRTIPDIRNWHNMNNLWNNRTSGDNEALWHRYKDANMGRQRSVALRVADQYYLDRTGGQGPHSKIFAVMKYTNHGWDPKDQNVVLAFVNLQPGTAHSGSFNVNVAPIYLDPTRTYNVRNLASTTPNTYLWEQGRSGAAIAANGIYVAFPAARGQEGSIAQFLKLEEHGGSPPPEGLQWIGNTRHWPTNGAITSTDELWIDVESYPIGAANGGSVTYSTDNVTWSNKALSANGTTGQNDAWHVNLGKFAAGATVRYAVQITQSGGTNFVDNNNGANYSAVVNSGGSGEALQWIGNVSHWPPEGEVTSLTDLWIDIQAWPVGAAANGAVVYSSDNGQTWPMRPLEFNHTSESNDFWHANLGAFPAGAVVQFAVTLSDANDNQLWANNDGSNYWVTVSGSGTNLQSVHWVGNTISRGLLVPDVAAFEPAAGGALSLRLASTRPGSVYDVYYSTNHPGGIVAAGTRRFRLDRIQLKRAELVRKRDDQDRNAGQQRSVGSEPGHVPQGHQRPVRGPGC
jgi:hypothetical protein